MKNLAENGYKNVFVNSLTTMFSFFSKADPIKIFNIMIPILALRINIPEHKFVSLFFTALSKYVGTEVNNIDLLSKNEVIKSIVRDVIARKSSDKIKEITDVLINLIFDNL